MSKYLILKGSAGLGNRLFTLLNALVYCQLSGRKLFVDWSDGQFGEKHENVFNIFFNIKHPLYVSQLPEFSNESNDVFPASWRGNLSKSVYDIFKVGKPSFLLRNFPSFFLSKEFMTRKSQLWVKKSNSSTYGFKALFDKENMSFGSNLSLENNSKFLVYSDFIPDFNNIHYLPFLKLRDSFVNEIDNWDKEYNLSNNYLGIHVRSSDKKPEISVKRLIEHVKDKHDSMSIFLSTDSIEVEKLFQSNFKNKLLLFPKKIPYSVNGRGIHMWGLDNNDHEYNKEMLEASIFDIWLLSKCKILYYQGNSSFSTFSKFLHPKSENCINWLKIFD
jgi:hypothetical protein